MNKLIATLALLVVVCIMISSAQVNSGRYRSARIRLIPGKVHKQPHRFTLSKTATNTRVRTKSGLRRVRLPIRRISPDSESATSKLGPVSALRAGEEGSYDFADQFNAIVPEKNVGKPTKENEPAVSSNTNKINIESKLAAQTEENNVIVEQAYVGETAIVHCTFDNIKQIGAYRQAKIWWTKLSDREGNRPVILAAGSQIRIPDDRLRVVTFPDNTFSILIIKNVLPEDVGQYKCSLPTITGTETEFTQLQVQESRSDNVAISPKETSLNSGDELNLFCKPDNPDLNVWWTAKDAAGNNIDVTRGFDRVAGRSLTIKSIQRNQAGIYTCHVDIGIGSPIRRHFTVQVKERPLPIEAYVAGFRVNSLLANYNKDPVYGDNVNLRCDSGGIPIPTILWYKDGRLLSESYKYALTSYEPTYKDNSVISKLTIKSFQKYDEGRYECRATNEAGSQDQEFDIQGKSDETNDLLSDDEDIERGELKGRNGALKISVCKAGRPCKTIQSGNSNSRRRPGGVSYSGDEEN